MKLELNALIKAINGKVISATSPSVLAETVIEDITTDSRKELVNGLFIPLIGEKFDAHDFISNVYEKGNKAVLTMKEEIVDPRLITIKVEDTGKALLQVARFYKSKFNIPFIGVTGSVGKTSTKEIIASILEGKYKVHKTQGNFNNEIGLPLTLFGLKKEHQAAVIEMGMNHFGEIHNLTCTVNPDIAVITNIGTSHIENLGSREGILKAKLEILDGLSEKGLLVINGDNDLLKTVKNLSVNTVTYGLDASNDYWAENILCEGEQTSATIHSPIKKYTISLNTLGEHMIYNALAGIAIAEHLGLKEDEIQRGIKGYQPTKMRMHPFLTSKGTTLIDDTYNASVDSMKAALKVLATYKTTGKKIAVLGDMFEMGEFAPKLHREVGEFASKVAIDKLITIGELAHYIDEGYAKNKDCKVIHYDTKELFIKAIDSLISEGDCILFKASRGMHFEELVEEVRKVK